MLSATPKWFVLTTLFALGVFCGEAATQTPLPTSMKAEYFWNDTVAFWLRPSAPGPKASVVFDTAGKTVTLDWDFSIPGSEGQHPVGFVSSGSRSDEVSVSYEPTAVCRQAGVGSIFYVAGWVKRLSMSVIERWEVKDMAFLTTTNPNGTLTSALTLTYEKSTVLATTTMGPIRCMDYHFTADRLWVLEDDAPNNLVSIDPNTGAASPIADTTTVPELASMHSTRAIFIDPAAPSGGGFYLLLRPEADWDLVQSDQQDPQSKIFFTRDSNFDGVIDEQVVKTLNDTEAAIDSAFYTSQYN
ncbi:MAG: hypothetical protein ACI9EF_001969 [Pseudohongiellaceae bacterium]|jgi:hypothetical protein